MKVTVNGELASVDDDTTAAAVLVAVGQAPRGVAVAVNEEVVPRSRWGDHRLRPGDRVEVLTAAQGG